VVPARKRHLAQRQCLPCHGTKFSTVPATEGNSVSIIEYRDDDVQVLHIELVTYQQVQTCISRNFTQVYYKNFLTTLRECVGRRRPDMWKNASWILHHDNAPAHNALSVKRYLAKSNIPVMEHPPYSPDLAPCDFFLFPKIKSALEGTRFESVDAVKAKATQLLNSLTQDDLHHCFQQWKIRMERCRDWGGDYIEGDNISIVRFFFQ